MRPVERTIPKMNNRRNIFLIAGGILSIIASLLHIAIIIGGAEWLRFFGAGEAMAKMAEEGSIYPIIITFIIASVLFLWALYAFSGAGIIRRLPYLKPALVLITAVYLIRGFGVIPAYFIQPDLIDDFMIWSSVICSVYGIFYLIGTISVWDYLSEKE